MVRRTLLGLLGGTPLIAATDSSRPAELVLRAGTLYTVEDRQPRAQAAAVRGGRIVFVGTNRGVGDFIGKDTRVIDLQGRTGVPGLTDAHYHLSGVGARALTFNLAGTKSLADFLARVQAQV